MWALLGWVGAHRFYLGREGTGLLMLFTVGGGLLWWAIDAALLGRMVRGRRSSSISYSVRRWRQTAGLPPAVFAVCCVALGAVYSGWP